jgi:tetratricopeptide (TPR) repeat protein
MDPEREQTILKEIANSYYSARKYDQAIEAFKNLNAKYPTPNSQFKLMDAYYMSKNWKETITAADTFIAQNPGNPIGFLYKAKGLYFQDTTNERKASIDMYKVFLESTKDTAFAKTFLVSDLIEANGKIMQYYVNKNNYKEALIYCNELVRLDPNNANYNKYKEALEKRIKGVNTPAPKPGTKPEVKPK